MHAHLSILSPDRRVRQTLIEHGYPRLGDIVAAARAEFVAENRDGLGDFKPAQTCETARAKARFLSNMCAGMQSSAPGS